MRDTATGTPIHHPESAPEWETEDSRWKKQMKLGATNHKTHIRNQEM